MLTKDGNVHFLSTFVDSLGMFMYILLTLIFYCLGTFCTFYTLFFVTKECDIGELYHIQNECNMRVCIISYGAVSHSAVAI